MKCPDKCNHNLKKAIIYNVEIVYCPSCMGIWLKRKQLDEIIENSSYEFDNIENFDK